MFGMGATAIMPSPSRRDTPNALARRHTRWGLALARASAATAPGWREVSARHPGLAAAVEDAALLALTRAIESHDPPAGPFRETAAPRIRRAVLDALLGLPAEDPAETCPLPERPREEPPMSIAKRKPGRPARVVVVEVTKPEQEPRTATVGTSIPEQTPQEVTYTETAAQTPAATTKPLEAAKRELAAMAEIIDRLTRLEPTAARRVIAWAGAAFGVPNATPSTSWGRARWSGPGPECPV